MSSSQRDPSWSARPTRASGSPSGYARSVAWPSQWRSFASNSRTGRSTSNVLRMAQLDRLPRQVRYGVQLAGVAWPQLFRPLVLELASHRPIREVLPGVHHWTAIHPRIRLPVDSYYIQPARVVLDPTVPREGLEWFKGREPPGQVILTNRHHLRHSERYAAAFGCPIRCTAAGGALAFADGLTRPRGGGLAFVPGFLMGDDAAAVRAALRESLRGLLDLDFDNLLFAPGEPLVGGAKAAMREF